MDTTQAPESIYHALSDNRKEIRLLHIQPASQHIDPIHCYLSTTSLDDDIAGNGSHYEALSYAWGVDIHDAPVHVDEQLRKVTVNLYHALQHLRHPSRERIMWIDALCINQSNLPERTHQVGMMRDVFERASSTTVWLGLSTGNECGLAMKLLARLGNDKNLHLFPPLMPYVEVEEKCILSSEIRTGLKLFFGDPWWSRVWTVQEWVLSRHVIFQHGPFLLESQVLKQTLEHSESHVHSQSCCFSLMFGHARKHDLNAHFSKLHDIDNLTGEPGNMSLPLIISLFRRTRGATNPRDIIYGMLGLARGHYENAVCVDYTLTIEAAFEAATIQMIQQTGSLEVLSHIPGGVDPTLTLPSYVPDWTVPYYGEEHVLWVNWLRNVHLYSACKGEAATLTVIGHGSIQLKGLKVDEIDEILVSELAVGPGFIDALVSFTELHGARTQAGLYQISESGFCSTLCGSLEHYINKGVPYIRRISMTKEQASIRLERWVTWNSMPMRYFWAEYDQDWSLRNFVYVYKAMKAGRRLAITKNGRLAWCPRTCQKGDVVSVLAGGRVPFILRRAEDDKYKFLGDAYVHAIMAGEAVDEMHTNGSDWEDINLI